MPKASTTHVVCGPTPHVGSCLRCGATLDLEFPMKVREVVRRMEAFTREHRNCLDSGQRDGERFIAADGE